ncbi:MAG: hypothetical protein V4666_00875 [Bacteroidota bacterium]
MTEYQAKSNSSLSFDLTREEELIGRLIYKSWFKFDAEMEIANGSSYQIVPKGFWGTTIELKDKEKILLNFKMNWNGEIVVQTYFNDLQKDYLFKHKGIFKESFILLDQEETELLVMKPHLKWSKMNYEYQITTFDNFENISNKEIVLTTSLLCANYYMSMMASSMGV